MKLEEQTGEILGVAKFRNLQISQLVKFRRLRNFATCEISQVAKFRNMRNFASFQFSQPLTCDSPVSPDYFFTHLLVV